MDTENFPHQAVGYSLQGHQRMADGSPFTCADCHLQEITRFDPTTCDACHRELDVQFTQAHVEAFGGDCLACHDGLDTYGQAFDHNRLAFPLQGAHASLTCSACHQGARTTADLQAASRACHACHTPPVSHVGLFDTACADCHTVNAWTPAQFNRPHTFPITHRNRGRLIECGVCHPNTYTAYTCYGCHEHNPAKVERKHLKEGIRDFQKCVECHPTGREEEGEGEEHD